MELDFQDRLRVSKRRRDLALAEWRHAWDYEKDDERKDWAYDKALEAQAAVDAYEVLSDYWKRHYRQPSNPDTFERLCSAAKSRLRSDGALRY